MALWLQYSASTQVESPHGKKNQTPLPCTSLQADRTCCRQTRWNIAWNPRGCPPPAGWVSCPWCRPSPSSQVGWIPRSSQTVSVEVNIKAGKSVSNIYKIKLMAVAFFQTFFYKKINKSKKFFCECISLHKKKILGVRFPMIIF